MTKSQIGLIPLIGHSDFFRHLSFAICHFADIPLLATGSSHVPLKHFP